MRGGSTLIAAGEYAFSPSMQGGIDVLKNNTGLKDLLESYGVQTESALVMDEQNSAFPVPVVRNLGGFSVREIQLVRYPPFVDVRGAGLDNSNPATRAIPGVILQWTNPVRCKQAENLPKCKALLTSSDNAWTVSDANVQPDFQTYPKLGFSVPEKRSRVPLAASVVGSFPSYFAKREAPVLDGEAPPPAGAPGAQNKDEGKKKGRRGHVIERSPDGTRVVVVGSSSFLDDVVLQIASQVSESALASLQFTNNLVDWSVEDASLLDIRAKEQYARTLKHTEEGTQIAWEWGNYLFALLAVIGIGLVTLNRRKSVRPLVELTQHQGN
jgi:ABC-2 type transport system permease protein